MDRSNCLNEDKDAESNCLSATSLDVIGRLLAAAALYLLGKKGLRPADPTLSSNLQHLRRVLAAIANLIVVRRAMQQARISVAKNAVRQFQNLCRPAQTWAAP